MARTLVVVISETRTHELSFQSFSTHLLEAYDADLALCVARNPREDLDNPFYRAAKHVWTYDEPEDFGDAFDHMQQVEGGTGDWRSLLQVRDQWLGGVLGPGAHTGSAGIVLFFRWFLKQSLLRADVLEAYDRFVVTRSDFVHATPQVPLSMLDPDYLWIPDGEDWGGLTDRHLVANRQDILLALSVADEIVVDPVGLGEAMQHRTDWNLERYLPFAFERLGLLDRVRRFPYTMYAVRAPGGHTRWQEGRFYEDRGYFIKYDEEFRGAQIASWMVREPGDWTPRMVRLVGAMIRGDRWVRRHSGRRWAQLQRIVRVTGLARVLRWVLWAGTR